MLELLADPKKAATLIVSKGKDGEKIEKEKPENEYGVGIEQSGKKLMEAMKSNDVKKFVSEMKNFIYMINMEEMDMEGESEEEMMED